MSTHPNDTSPPTPRSRRWLRPRRLLVILLVLLVVAPLLAVALGALALRSSGVRQALIGRLSQTIEESSGIRIRAADFSLHVRDGVLELDSVALSAGDALPFLTAERVRFAFEWRELFGDPPVLRSVTVERPVADLGQPLPPTSDEPPPPIDIHELRLTDGRLIGAVPEGDGEPWLTGWTADDVGITGSYLDGRTDLALSPASLRLVRAREGPLDLRIESRIGGPLEGPYVLDDLKLTGEGLRLDASAELGTAEGQPLLVRLDLDADPSLLLSEIGPGERLRAQGEIDLRLFRGHLSVRAKDFPSAALEPWIGEAARPGGRPSLLDLDARFESDPDASQQVTGRADLVWRREDGKHLADVSATLADGRLDEAGVVLESLVGEVHAAAADLPAEILRPWLGAGRLDRFSARGTRLDLEADFVVDAAAPSEPTGAAQVVWRRGSERLLEATARTAGEDSDGLVLAFDAVLLPAEAGRRRFAGRLAAPSWPELASGELRDTVIELALPDVTAAVDDVYRRWPRLAEDVGLVPAELPEALRGAVEATARLEGPLEDPHAELDATWRPDEASSLALAAAGRPLGRSGEASLALDRLDLAALPGSMTGLLSGSLEARGASDAWTASWTLDGTDLRYGADMPAFEELHLEASTDGTNLEIASLKGRTDDTRFEGQGRLALAARIGDVEIGQTKIRSGHLHLAADRPFTGIDRLDFDADLEGGTVHVTRLDLDAPTGPGSLAAEIPLGALRAFEVDVDTWPVEVASGRIKVDLGFPSLDVGKLALDVGQEPPWTSHVASLAGRLWIDPADLTATEGELLVESWHLELDRYRISVADDPILLALADRKLEVLPVTLQTNGHTMDFEATVDLRAGWRPGDAVGELVEHLTARAAGKLESALLTPYLGGGVAEGTLKVTAEASGTLDELKAHAVVDGPKASLVYTTPYVTQIRAPHLELDLTGGDLTVTGATAQLNGGPVYLDALRNAGGDWVVGAKFESARYRLDYGLTTILNGDLKLELPAEGAGSLSGEVEVYRAVQRRDLRLDREVLDALFAPPDLSGAGVGPLGDLQLDLTVTTAQGFRVKNNLLDVSGSWSTITVQGPLANPAIAGRIDVDPGGYLYAYGQTARLDQGSLTFTGEPGLPPEIDVQPVWDTEDVTVGAGGDALQQVRMSWRSTMKEDQPQTLQLDDRLVRGLTGYVGGRLSEKLGGARVRIQPVLVFGETDPSAKLVVSRDLSTWIAFAVAVDLRDSQRQTYVLDLHKLKNLPRVAFQLFTEDGETDGVTVQQTLRFGKSRLKDDALRLHSVFFETVHEGVSEKRLRRAVGYARGEALPEEADFEVEVNLGEHLRRRGYPDARVDVVMEPRGAKSADLAVAIGLGPRVVFEFEGTKPPAALRRSITEPYRADFYERASLEEVRQQTVRALRSQGYLEPRVEVEVRSEDPRKERTVEVRSEGGRQVRLDRLEFRGVEAETSIALRSWFESLVARIELAAAEPAADDWLVRNLRSQGYPEARIASRTLSQNGRELVVGIEPGPRQQIAEVRVTGLPDAETARFLKELPVRVGDPPRADLVVAGNLLIRNDLKNRGYAEARVRSRLEPAAEGSTSLDLVYEVERGPQYRLGPVSFAGLRSTRPKWAGKIAELEESQVLDPNQLAGARRRLFETRLFRTVRTSTERFPEDGLAKVTFEVEEAPRFQLGYGVRWESKDEASASGAGSSLVVDVLDRNFLGRGVTLGLRGLYGNRDRAARLYASRTGFFGRRLAIELYLERRREQTRPTQDFVDDSLLIDTTEGSIQLAFPLGSVTSRVYTRARDTHIREKIPFDPFFPFEERIRFPFVGWQTIYDRLNDRVSPTRGIFVSTDLSVSGDYIGSDFDFVRLFTHFKWMRPAFRIGERELVWAQSYRLGLLTSQDEFPLSDELFFAGGERSVRGYPFESLADSVRGGEALLVINQELRFPVWGPLSGLVFLDVGNAWGEKSDFGSDFFTGMGLGIRAETPIGLLRLDFGYPLDRRDGDSTVKTYFGFGHAF